jgi:hypothetical protein
MITREDLIDHLKELDDEYKELAVRAIINNGKKKTYAL